MTSPSLDGLLPELNFQTADESSDEDQDESCLNMSLESFVSPATRLSNDILDKNPEAHMAIVSDRMWMAHITSIPDGPRLVRKIMSEHETIIRNGVAILQDTSVSEGSEIVEKQQIGPLVGDVEDGNAGFRTNLPSSANLEKDHWETPSTSDFPPEIPFDGDEFDGQYYVTTRTENPPSGGGGECLLHTLRQSVKDPDARKFDAERVLCAVCDTWIQVPVPDERQVCQAHKAACRANAGSSSSSSVSVIAIAQSQSPSSAAGAHAQGHSRPVASPSHAPPPHVQSLSAHHSHNHADSRAPPPHFNESRRRNAEQRAATLRADSLILHVEPNRVFCSLCQKWVQLRQDSSYCAYPWLQHRTKCLVRSQKRAAKERVHSGERMEKIEIDAESEDAEASWDEEEPQAPPMSAPPHLQTSRHVSHHAPPHRDTMAERYSNGQHHPSGSHPIPPPRQTLVQPSDSYLDLDAPSVPILHSPSPICWSRHSVPAYSSLRW
ncbi:hypothetical protein BDZ89DRAFT_1064048 [Hymenopellis radicata]|nr:hypothetical protein BDZ89DRAFT_1064048 [Hymenopellis radicata]